MNQIEIKRIRISPEVHKLTKVQSSKEGICMYMWIENLILKAVKENNPRQ